MTNIVKNRYKRLSVYFFPDEWERLKARIDNSTCRSVNEFIRKALLGKPLGLFYRNQSMDELVNECIVLRKEMQVIRETAPHDGEKLIKLIGIQEDIKRIINQIAEECMHK